MKSLRFYWKQKYFIPVLVIALFAIIGVIILFVSRAATPFASVEPEKGTTSGVTSTTDNKASNGSYIQFGTKPTGGGTVGTGPSQATCPVGGCGALSATSATISFPDGVGSTFSRNLLAIHPAGLSGSVPVVMVFSDGQACSTTLSTCVDGSEAFFNIAAAKKFMVLDIRCQPSDHGVVVSNGCQYMTPDPYPWAASGGSFSYCGPSGNQVCNDDQTVAYLIQTWLPTHIQSFCTGGSCSLDTSRVFLEGGSKGRTMIQEATCSMLSGPLIAGAFGGSTQYQSIATSSVGPPAASAVGACPYLLQSGTYNGQPNAHRQMDGYYEGLGDHPLGMTGGSSGRWNYSEDQAVQYLTGPAYGCPHTPSATPTLTSNPSYSGSGQILAHIYDCNGGTAQAAIYLTPSSGCHAGSCDGDLSVNTTLAYGFQFGPEMWQFWTTGTFF